MTFGTRISLATIIVSIALSAVSMQAQDKKKVESPCITKKQYDELNTELQQEKQLTARLRIAQANILLRVSANERQSAQSQEQQITAERQKAIQDLEAMNPGMVFDPSTGQLKPKPANPTTNPPAQPQTK